MPHQKCTGSSPISPENCDSKQAAHIFNNTCTSWAEPDSKKIHVATNHCPLFPKISRGRGDMLSQITLGHFNNIVDMSGFSSNLLLEEALWTYSIGRNSHCFIGSSENPNITEGKANELTLTCVLGKAVVRSVSCVSSGGLRRGMLNTKAACTGHVRLKC